MINVLCHIKIFIRSLSRNKISRLLTLTIFIIFVGALGLHYFEETTSIQDAFWWSFVTITTVGYGDISPSTPGGRIIGIVVMVFGIGMLGMFTATIASIFVEGKRKEEKGRKSVSVSDHFIICEWSLKAREIIEELRADEKVKDKDIVLIADLPEKPLEDDNMHFICGEVGSETLEKANLKEASVVMALSNHKVDSGSRDAKTILNVLTIRTLNPDIYICSELEDAKNLPHCKMAGANEVIVIGKLSSNLLVQASLDHGITHFITELVSNRIGNQLYKVKPSDEIIGKKFIDVLTQLKKEQNSIVVAIESTDSKNLDSNPDIEYVIQPDDLLLVVAKERPSF